MIARYTIRAQKKNGVNIFQSDSNCINIRRANQYVSMYVRVLLWFSTNNKNIHNTHTHNKHGLFVPRYSTSLDTGKKKK